MKKIYVSAAAVAGLLLGGSMSCFAGESVFSDLKPYVGIEAIQTSMKFKDRFGSNIFKKNPVDYNIFAGLNFTEIFGVEAGFESHKKLKRTATIRENEYEPGELIPIPATNYNNDATTFNSYHPYLGITARRNLADFGLNNTSLHFMVGTSLSKIKATSAVLSSNFGPEDPIIVNTYKKSKIIPMVKVGISQELNEHFSIKGSFSWKNLSKFNIQSDKYNGTGNTSTIKLKDSYSVGLSLLYSL